ncbi:hypothetical protein H7U37_07985 [Pseudoflavonifractor phocaeensis]|uniref:hypothetical protein n=1 Tax=Pseudoflavonifractor phocaeensis TaxID=1870988 RepID=UPI001959A535|nr:hypothetical protein [Pseudoflavonifractor phocaeensis]MBM6938460.1 hypothetical protein [Pseudoflavonifractor phocaeensis]
MAETKLIYRDVAPGAQEAAELSMEDTQPFSDLEAVNLGVDATAMATGEWNQWPLDGSREVFPDAPEPGAWGAWSLAQSDEEGQFSTPPVLTIQFDGLFSSVGLSFSFDTKEPCWCSALNIKWYRDALLLAQQDFAPDAAVYTCLREVSAYNKLVITFRKTVLPFRFLKLQEAVYGQTRIFTSGELRRVNLFQAASVISEELEINTCDLTLSSKDPVPFLFQRKQPMEVYHGGILQGVFYVSASKRVGTAMYEIETSDAVGLLEEENHMGGVYAGKRVDALAAEILGHNAYDLDPSLAGMTVFGWLPIATRRENLAQLAFAIGAVVDTSGSQVIRIYPVQSSVTADFGPERIYSGSDIDTAALVTGVEVTAHKYTAGTESKELFRDTLTGHAMVTFGEPVSDLSISGGTLLEHNANYAVLSGTGGVVTLMGKPYQHTTRTVKVEKSDLQASEVVNVYQVTDATLVGDGNAMEVAQRVYDYCQRRETVNAQLVLADERPGDVVTVQTEFDGVKEGTILSLDIDLARKRIGEAVILCR